MRIATLLGTLAIGVALAAVVSEHSNTHAVAAAPDLKQAPDFKLMNQDNKPVSLSDYKGKVVVLEWVNPNCPFVQRHYKAGTMLDLQGRYKPQGVVWLSINSTRTFNVDQNKKWAQDQKVPYPVLDDHEGVVAREYGAKTTPHMFVIDAKGQIVYQGAIDDDPPGKKADAVNYVNQAR